MIVDLHTHLASWETDISSKVKNDLAACSISPEQWHFSEEDYLRGTKAADRAVVFGLKAQKTGWGTNNAEVAAFVSKHSPKYLFFAAIDPLDPDFMEQLRYCHDNLGCKGVKLGPIYQGVHPLDAKYYEIYAYCQQNHLPIVTHMAATFSSGVPMEYARPILMDHVACDFPDLKIILAHMGHPWENETIVCIRKQPNLFADISALYYRPMQFYHSMKLLEEYGSVEKVFFGSDFPACTTEESIQGLKNLNKIIGETGMPPVSQSLIDEILYKNPIEILGLESY